MIGLILTSGCAAKYQVVTRDCIIFKKVPMKQEVKDWFVAARPKATPAVVDFLDNISNNNERLGECPDG